MMEWIGLKEYSILYLVSKEGARLSYFINNVKVLTLYGTAIKWKSQ
jgi:hypothetical protein